MTTKNADGQTVFLPKDLDTGVIALIMNSSGWAKPNPDGDIVAALMPEDAKIQAPWGELNGQANVHYHQCCAMTSYAGVTVHYWAPGFQGFPASRPFF